MSLSLYNRKSTFAQSMVLSLVTAGSILTSSFAHARVHSEWDHPNTKNPRTPAQVQLPGVASKTESAKVVGPTCVSNDSNHLCLALKYVVYKDQGGTAVVSADEARENVKEINNVWNQCNIAFEMEEFDQAEPQTLGLSYDPANDSELSDIRNRFLNDSTLLVVTTGAWDRSGSLGYSAANAWTSLPGEAPFGAVLEQSVGTYPNIIAHEIGHYLNLLHYGDSGNLMNPIIYPDSNTLGSDQCELARSTALSSWQKMLR